MTLVKASTFPAEASTRLMQVLCALPYDGIILTNILCNKMINDITFRCSIHPTSAGTLAPRLGSLSLHRRNGQKLKLDSPGLITITSRGVVPHLTRDHVEATDAVKWIHLPFETFLERQPPAPTLQTGENLLHTFLGFSESKHVLSVSLRDPIDERELPANGNKYINAVCIRGVRKVTPLQFKSYMHSCRPDLVVALSDIPSAPPHSQKRITKSLERSISWLSTLMEPFPALLSNSLPDQFHPLKILVHMSGHTNPAARHAFANSLMETLSGKEAEQLRPLKRLDDGLLGYSFDLVPLRASLIPTARSVSETIEMESSSIRRSYEGRHFQQPFSSIPEIASLIKISLEPLPMEKPRVVTGTSSPHEVLCLIRDIGIDFFDITWAQKAADWGIALDFSFPVPVMDCTGNVSRPTRRADGKSDLGHNLYLPQYASDFSRLSSHYSDRASASTSDHDSTLCPCIACSPVTPSSSKELTYDPPFTRAYVHHLLHTHEMSAHALLTAHNLSVTEAFFSSIRNLLEVEFLSQSDDTKVSTEAMDNTSLSFSKEIERFNDVYDIQLRVFEEARMEWMTVDFARGKGRLAREKAKQDEAVKASSVKNDTNPSENVLGN